MRLTGAFSIAVMASALAIPAAAQAPGTRLPNAASLNAAAVQFLLQDEATCQFFCESVTLNDG